MGDLANATIDYVKNLIEDNNEGRTAVLQEDSFKVVIMTINRLYSL